MAGAETKVLFQISCRRLLALRGFRVRLPLPPNWSAWARQHAIANQSKHSTARDMNNKGCLGDILIGRPNGIRSGLGRARPYEQYGRGWDKGSFPDREQKIACIATFLRENAPSAELVGPTAYRDNRRSKDFHNSDTGFHRDYMRAPRATRHISVKADLCSTCAMHAPPCGTPSSTCCAAAHSMLQRANHSM